MAAPSTAAVSVALFTARAIVDELVRGGVRRVCVAPGSRSTALALAVAERSDLTSHVLTDERSMGFFALGLARASTEPVAVVCTSGTAVANLLPAVAEAALGGGALLLLTADRPPELRDCAAPQTIDQVGIFGSHARWAVDVPILDATTEAARVLRSMASRAVAIAVRGSGGPVHLNIPLREPFLDASFPARERFSVAAREDGRPFTAVAGRDSLHADEARELADRLGRAKRGVIVCAGHEVPPAPVALLAKALGWPILADPLSGLRFGDHDRTLVVDAIEPLMRNETMRRELRPDAIVRFGLTPPPRSVQRWLDEAWPAEHVVVSEDPWPDPSRSASIIVRADAREFCRALALALGSPNPHVLAWRDEWLAVSAASRAALDRGLDHGLDQAGDQAGDHGADHGADLFDGIVLGEVASALPAGATLFVGNSMPVRDAEAFLGGSDKSLRVMASRGASGIDGVLSTALGVAVATSDRTASRSDDSSLPGNDAAPTPTPVALVIGDLSFLHDSAALVLAVRERIPLLIVVVNNDGGGIFSYLPLREELSVRAGAGSNQASPAGDPSDATSVSGAGRANDVFERFFGTPHGADLERVASVTGGFFRRVTERAALAGAVRDALAASASGPAVLEVRTDRETARTTQQAIVGEAQRACRHLIPLARRPA